jgi:hypothetical protein
MLGGGPTSQHPQERSQQIRSPLPRVVTMLPQRYPQLLCAPGAFEPGIARSDDESLDQRADIAVARLTMPQRVAQDCI